MLRRQLSRQAVALARQARTYVPGKVCLYFVQCTAASISFPYPLQVIKPEHVHARPLASYKRASLVGHWFNIWAMCTQQTAFMFFLTFTLVFWRCGGFRGLLPPPIEH